jgi:Xaa-Pro aminopeptidase
MRLEKLPKSEFTRRTKRVQEELKKRGLDVLVTYSSECESSSSRYLADFWPFFDFASVVVPAEGDPALVTGGPESYDFAKKFSYIDAVRINPLLVETSAPDWVQDVEGESFETMLPEICGKTPRVVGISDWNIFPHIILDDLKKGAPDVEYVRADDVLLAVKTIKADVEIPYIEKAYEIVEEGMKTALEAVKPGMREYEVESIARRKMLELGAEGMPYPAWVCSGPNTTLSLCRSTQRELQKGDLVQFTFGSKFMGYCGNMCRPFVIGDVAKPARKLMEAALEATDYALKTIRPGVKACDLFQGYYNILAKYGYQEFTLYGPAHGTGYSEVEGLWLSKNADFVIQPNMLFNIDIWLSDGTYGMRYEEGILTTEDGIKELNNYRREIISL